MVNPTKAAVTRFSLNNHIVNTPTPTVNLGPETVERTQAMNYLVGIRFDRSLSYNEHIDQVIIKAKRGLAAMRVMAAANCEQRHLCLLYEGLVMYVLEYAMAILTFSRKQIERVERIQNEAMQIILGCTRDTACRAMRYILDFPTIEDRIQICRARVFLRVNANTQHPLHSEIMKVKGSRLKRGRSWMGQAEDNLQQVCSLEDLEPGDEWV